MKFWLYIVEMDIAPNILGPYATETLRDAAARDEKKKRGDNDGIFWLDTDTPAEATGLATGAYSGSFFVENPLRDAVVDIIMAGGEGLLNDTGVDNQAAESMAEEIITVLKNGVPVATKLDVAG